MVCDYTDRRRRVFCHYHFVSRILQGVLRHHRMTNSSFTNGMHMALLRRGDGQHRGQVFVPVSGRTLPGEQAVNWQRSDALPSAIER